MGRTLSVGSTLLLQGRVVEQLLDQIHVGQQHAAAAVALQAQSIQGIPAGEESWLLPGRPGRRRALPRPE